MYRSIFHSHCSSVFLGRTENNRIQQKQRWIIFLFAAASAERLEAFYAAKMTIIIAVWQTEHRRHTDILSFVLTNVKLLQYFKNDSCIWVIYSFPCVSHISAWIHFVWPSNVSINHIRFNFYVVRLFFSLFTSLARMNTSTAIMLSVT